MQGKKMGNSDTEERDQSQDISGLWNGVWDKTSERMRYTKLPNMSMLGLNWFNSKDLQKKKRVR